MVANVGAGVGLVSGNGLGLSLSSLATLGQRGVIGSAVQGRSGERAYVNVANGNLVVQDLDERLLGTGVNAGTLRTYNSQGSFGGSNWATGVERKQVLLQGSLGQAGSHLVRTDEDGASAIYDYDATLGLYRSTEGDGAHDTLQFDGSSGTYTWTDGSTRATERYEASGSGRLLSSSDTSGNTVTYGYAGGRLSSVTDASGETTQFVYAGGLLESLVTTVLEDGQPVRLTRVHYVYDGSQRLQQVTVDLSPEDNSVTDGYVYQTTYTYDGSSTRLQSMVQTDGTELRVTYVQVGGDYRVETLTDGTGALTRFGYDTAAATTSVTDATGRVTRFAYDAQRQLTAVTAPAVNGQAPSMSFEYDGAGNVLRVHDGDGRTVEFGYDAQGNQTLQRDDQGNTITRSFGSAFNQLLTETVYTVPDADGAGAGAPGGAQTARLVYSATDRLRFTISAEGRVTEYRFNAQGLRVATLQYAGLYDTGALGATVSPAEATLAAWAAAQNPSVLQRVDMAYDFRGQLSRITSYAEVDAAGVGVLAGASVQHFVYNQAGDLLQTISGASAASPDDGVLSQYVYDGLGRLTLMTEALDAWGGRVTATTYDDAGRRIVVEAANGLVTTSTYDKAGRLVGVFNSSAGALDLGTTTYSYDAAGRLRMTQDPTGVRSYVLYDASGRKSADIDADGTVVQYLYDRGDHLTRSIAHGQKANVALLVDAQGRPAEIDVAGLQLAEDPADRSSWNVYDAAGRLAVQVDAEGGVTEYTYDGASRLLQTVRRAEPRYLGGLGDAPDRSQVAVQASADDRVSRRLYDADGKLVGTLDGDGYLVEYRYDALGRNTLTVSYARETQASLRANGSLAQLLVVLAGDPKASTVHTWYNARGQAVAVLDGERHLTETTYDLRGNVSSIVRYDAEITADPALHFSQWRPASKPTDQVRSFTYTAFNQLDSATDEFGVTTVYGYDAVGRLELTVSAYGTAEQRTSQTRHDALGRVTARLPPEAYLRLHWEMSPEQIDAIWASSATQYSYDAAGRMVRETDPNGNATLYFYRADGLLSHTVDASGQVEERSYDALNQLTEVRRIGTPIAPATLAGLHGGLAEAPFVALVASLHDPAIDAVTSLTHDRRGAVTLETRNRLYQEGVLSTTGLAHHYNAFGEEDLRTEVDGEIERLATRSTYDRRGHLHEVIRDEAQSDVRTSATYDAFGRLKESVDANGGLTTYGYDRTGRTVTVEDPTHAVRRTAYDALGRVFTVTDATGAVTTYAYDDAAHSVTTTTREQVSVTTSFNANGETASVTDAQGNRTVYRYDRNGNLTHTEVRDALGALVISEDSDFDLANRPIETQDGNGHVVRYEYDAVNRLLHRIVDPDGMAIRTSQEYHPEAREVVAIDANGIRTVTRTDLLGQTLSVTVDPTDPLHPEDDARHLALTTRYSYDSQGRVLTVESPGHTLTRYEYDVLGRRTDEAIDPDNLNLRRHYEYDDAGNVVSVRDAMQQVTRYAYDADNRLLAELDPTDRVAVYAYDAEGRLAKKTTLAKPLVGSEGLPPRLDYVRDVVPNLRYTHGGIGGDQVDARYYDLDGRLQYSVDGSGGVVERRYDNRGNVIETVGYAVALADLARLDDPQWRPQPQASVQDEHVRQAYDAMNRLAYTVNGTGALSEITYNDNGSVRERRSFARPNLVAPGESASLQHLKQVADSMPLAEDARERFSYDAAGRLSFSADGTGAVVGYLRDGNGNVIAETRYATPIGASTAPDGVAADATRDRVTLSEYDHANRATFVLDATRSVTQRVYDANGNLLRQIAYATPLQAGRTLSQVSLDAQNDRVSHVVYDKANRVILSVDAAGGVIRRELQADGQATQTIAYASKVSLGSQTDATESNIGEQLLTGDADRHTYSFYYSNGLLHATVDAESCITLYDYDGLGRQTVVTQLATQGQVTSDPVHDRVTTFEYDGAGRVRTTTDALHHSESFTYDGLGNKKTFTNKNGALWQYDYDAAGRLVKETSPQVELVNTAMQADGNLNATGPAMASIVTRLVYDGLGNLKSRIEAEGRSEQRETSYEYDAAGRQVVVRYPAVGYYLGAAADGQTTVATLPRVEQTGRLGTLTVYNAFGEAVANQDVGGNWSYKTYDAAGHVRHAVDAESYVTEYELTAFGDVQKLTRYAQPVSLGTPAGQALSVQGVEGLLAGRDPRADRTVTTLYDRMGRAVQVDEGTDYVYDSSAGTAGQATKIAKMVYTAFGELRRQSALLDSANGIWADTTHFFDRLGRETGTVDAMGFLTERKFDALGNQTGSSEYADAVDVTLDGWDRHDRTSAADRSSVSEYDALGRKTRETHMNALVNDASGQLAQRNVETQYGYDAVGNLTRTVDAEGGETLSFYDAMGRVRAVAAPRRWVQAEPELSNAISREGAPVTEFRRDAYGNVVVRIDHAQAVTDAQHWEAELRPNGNASPIGGSRTTETRYDSRGNVLDVQDAAGGVRHMSYDKAGRLAKQWQTITDNERHQISSFQIFEYDKLGRQVRSIEPLDGSLVSTGVQLAGPVGSASWENTGSTQDESFLQWVGNNHVELAWGGLVQPLGGMVRVELTYRALGGQTLSRTMDIPAAGAVSGVVFDWPEAAVTDPVGGVSAVLSVRVLQQQGAAMVELYNEAPRASGTVPTTAPRKAVREQHFNAFGEVDRRLLDGSVVETMCYDRFGRLWKTNQGDGVDKAMLYDLQGNLTAEIRSSSAGVVKSLQRAADAQLLVGVTRTDRRYDALGRVVATVQSERSTLGFAGGVETSSAVNVETLVTSTSQPGNSSAPPWIGTNAVSLTWPDISLLGGGAVRVTFGYTGLNGSGAYSRTAMVNGSGATGASFTWADSTGIRTITSVRVEKMDGSGTWKTAIDYHQGELASRVIIPRSTSTVGDSDYPGGNSFGEVRVRVRELQSTEWHWLDSEYVSDLDDAISLNTSYLEPGAYEYQVCYRTAEDQSIEDPSAVKASGTLKVGISQLSEIAAGPVLADPSHGILQWNEPQAGVLQEFHIRTVGGGQWTQLPIQSDGNGHSWVDLKQLDDEQQYEYELVYLHGSDRLAFAHATGNITSYLDGSHYVGPVGEPKIQDGPFVWHTGVDSAEPVLRWSGPGAGTDMTLRYRLQGSSDWILAFQGQADGTLSDTDFSLTDLVPGHYEYELRFDNYHDVPQPDGMMTGLRTGVLTVTAAQPAHTETREVPTQVLVWVKPPSAQLFRIDFNEPGTYGPPVVVGYDENGLEIFGPHYRVEPASPNRPFRNIQSIPYEELQIQMVTQTVQVPATPVTYTLQDMTPPYIPGHFVAGNEASYLHESTPAGDVLHSGASPLGAFHPDVLRPATERATVHQTLDRWGNVTELSDPRSAYWITRYTYDWSNHVLVEDKPIGDGFGGVRAQSRAVYDGLGQLRASIDALGNVHSYEYDAGGNRVGESVAGATAGEGHITTRYNAFGEQVEVVGLNHFATRYTHDRVGRLVTMARQVTASQVLTERYTYDEAGHRLSLVNAAGEHTEYQYDVAGNLVRTEEAVVRDWNFVGPLPPGQALQKLSSLLTSRSIYDANHHKTAEIDGNGFSTTWSYDYFGQVTAHTDLGGAVYTYAYDGLRLLKRQANTNGQDLNYEYDGAGQVVRIEDKALHQVSTFEYDLAGHRVGERVWQATAGTPTVGQYYQDNRLSYDAAGQLRLVTGLGGARIEYAYDANGNRIHQWGRFNKTSVDSQGTVQTTDFDYWSAYDVQNRQIVAEGVKLAAGQTGNSETAVQTAYGVIDIFAGATGQEAHGHRVTYDASGNRTSDLHYGLVAQQQGGGFLGYAVRTVSPQSPDEGLGPWLTDDSGAEILVPESDFGFDTTVGLYYVISRTTHGPTAEGGSADESRFYVVREPRGEPVTYAGVQGLVHETYAYDGVDRLTSVYLADSAGTKEIDHREYDAASRIKRNGPSWGIWNIDDSYWSAIGGNSDRAMVREYYYDGAGRLEHQDNDNAKTNGLETRQHYTYDGAGNVVKMKNFVNSDSHNEFFEYRLKRYEGYQQESADVIGGHTDYLFDANGRLVGTNDSQKAANSKKFVNDANGVILQTQQESRVLRELVVDGQVLGRYGVGPDENNPRDGNGNPIYAEIGEFDSSFRSISGSYPKPGSGSYVVVSGDTLQSIARSAYGDSKLWWKIAQANGLGGDDDLRMGQSLMIPSVAGNSNAADVFRPYDPGALIGDTTPYIKAPDDGCGTMGTVLIIAVTVAVAVATQQYYLAQYGGAAAASTEVAIAAGATGGAAGSVAGQVVANAAGIQDGFDWKQVALAAVGGGVGGAMQGWAPLGETHTIANAAVRSAIASAATQSVGVALDLQDEFRWGQVAAAALGGAAGQAANEGLAAMGWNQVTGVTTAVEQAQNFARSAVVGFAAGATTMLARGGRFQATQVATDAFGNALGESLGDAMVPQANSLYALTGRGARLGESASRVKLGTGDDGASLGGTGQTNLVNLVRDAADGEAFDRFEGVQFAGAASAPREIIKVGASERWRDFQRSAYEGVDELSAALSAGGQDPGQVDRLRNSALEKIDTMRRGIQADPAMQDELLARGLTFTQDIGRFAQLGAFGDQETVHRIAVATDRAGGVGRASGEAIAAQLQELAAFEPSFVNRIPGDARVEAVAPGLYMNTLLSMRSHVDTTMFYLASMTDTEMGQLGAYADSVIGSGGLTRYKDNEGLAAAWMGMQATETGMQRVGEGFSIASVGLRNIASSVAKTLAGSSPEAFANSTLGKLLGPWARPMYIVPPGTGRPVDFGALLRKLKGPPPEGMVDPHAHHILFKEGNGATQKALVAEGQALLRSYDIDPIMGPENLVWAPNRIAGQHNVDAVRNVVTELKQVHEFLGTREAMVKRLEELGQIAAQRK